MADKREVSYFYIGIFFLIGMAMIIAAVIIFGSKTLFKDYDYAETYFSESVQGLTKGSPVKYRGMDIGSVVDIASVDSIYSNQYQQNIVGTPTRLYVGSYIYVRMAIQRRFFEHAFGYSLESNLQEAIKHGLRMKLTVQGLTGTAYIEANFVDPSTPILPIFWRPMDYYIPSAPSTLSYFSENAQYLVRELRKIDFPKIFNSAQEMLSTSAHTMATANQTLDTANNAIVSNNKLLTETMRNLEIISQNLRTISERAKYNTSSVLFGKPPPKLDPNKL